MSSSHVYDVKKIQKIKFKDLFESQNQPLQNTENYTLNISSKNLTETTLTLSLTFYIDLNNYPSFICLFVQIMIAA